MLELLSLLLLHTFSPAEASPCNVTAECSRLTLDLVQLHITDVSDLSCLLNLDTPIGALAVNSVGEGLVVDFLANSSVLVLLPLTAWDDFNLNAAEWFIEDQKCWLQLKPVLGFEEDVHEMDIANHLQLKAELLLNDTEKHIIRALSLIPEHFWHINVDCEVPDMFYYTAEVTHIPAGRGITIQLWQRNSVPTVDTSTIRVSWMHAPSAACSQSELTVTVRSGCPFQKEFKFIYPEHQADSELVRLPMNYRPPSPLGSSLPTSPHVYNADPSQPLSSTYFKISQNAVFKQCQDGHSRAECNCSEEMEHSLDVALSDCIRKVYRHAYQQQFQLEFTISLGEGKQEEVKEPISLLEINGRTSFNIKGLKNGSVVPDSKDSVTIEFLGPGLFHFRATVETNSSFCNLTAYFTVYIDRTPLLKVSEHSIIVTTTVVFGGVVAFMYLIHHFKLVPHLPLHK